MQPENLGPLAAALAKAQAEFPAIKRNKEVDSRSYKFKYAPLDEIIAAVRPALTKNGLAMTQLLDGQNLVTMLIHESGSFLAGSVALPREGTVQQLGSAITYLRRYALQAILGIAAEEDDDGDAAASLRAAARSPQTRVDRVQGAIDAEQAASDAYGNARASQEPVASPAASPAGIASLHDEARRIFGADELTDIEATMTTAELFRLAEEADISKPQLTLAAKSLFGVNRWKVTDLTDEERAQLWDEVRPVVPA